MKIKHKKKLNWKQILHKSKKPSRLWLIVVAVSTLLIIVGSQYAMKDVSIFSTEETSIKAKVLEVTDSETVTKTLDGNETYTETNHTFTCELLSGSLKGKQIIAVQSKDSMYGSNDTVKDVEAGDLVIVEHFEHDGTQGNEWVFAEYYRFHMIVGLCFIFAVLMILIGRVKGINALVSLAFTAIFVFTVFLPWILSGKNVYVGVTITAGFTIVMSLLLIEGGSRKSIVTIISCFVGTAVAAIIPPVLNQFLHLSGMIDEHSIYLTMLNPEHPIDLIAIIFAGVIIGALGAAMDVAMDISSSMYEIIGHVPNISLKKLVRSGMEIGRDIMGTMANTLVLAYIGSSMCSVLLLFTYSSSLMDLLNKEIVIVELMQALSGSIALLLTVPFTALIAGFTYTRMAREEQRKRRSEERWQRVHRGDH